MPADSSSEYPEAFEEFWAQYPRKAGKRKALTAWLRARKRAPESAILDGAIRYAQDVNREEQFTKYPEGWLNADMWLDDPLPARTGPATPPAVSKSDAKVLGYLERGQRLADAARRSAQKEIS
ncbi:hypothetical protein [Rhodococcus jostii]|uniref:hypothetical protein n=1 Tax=Rhodococcus jostii TaxID=132919 RepID=UPI00362854A9